MTLKHVTIPVLLLCSLCVTAGADVLDVTQPGDAMAGFTSDGYVANDNDEGFIGNGGAYAWNKYPGMAIDDDESTSYLNFGSTGTGLGTGGAIGFEVSPSVGATTVNAIAFTPVVWDDINRDPSSFVLSGSNSATGIGSDSTVWTELASGDLASQWPTDWNSRHAGDLTLTFTFDNDTAYLYYRVEFAGIRDASSATSMEIAEVQLQSVPEPGTLCLVALGGLAAVGRRRHAGR